MVNSTRTTMVDNKNSETNFKVLTFFLYFLPLKSCIGIGGRLGFALIKVILA